MKYRFLRISNYNMSGNKDSKTESFIAITERRRTMNKEFLDTTQRRKLLDTAVISGDFILASGRRAEQKFDFDLIGDDTNTYKSVVLGLASCIRSTFNDYDGILTVANGATRLGEPLSEILHIPHLNSMYDYDENGVKHFMVEHPPEVNNVVIVDDVFTRGTNATKVALTAREHAIETIGVVVVLDRSGETAPTILSRVAVASLVQQELR